MKIRVFFFCLLFVICGLLFINNGCGSSTDTTTTTTSATTTTAVTGVVSLSGSLTTGVVPLGLRSSIVAQGAAVDYTVAAVDTESGKIYYGKTSATGTFSIEAPAGKTYEISLIDSDSKYIAPLVMAGTAASSETIMGAKPTADFSFGTVTYDASKGIAKPASEPSILNSADKADATSGIPKGAGSCGKDVVVAATREGSDMDKDGIPNIFDADEDGDGIRNGILKSPSTYYVSSNTVEAVFISSNIWSNHGSTEEAKDQIAMWLNVATPNDAALNQISSVEVIDVPASIKDVAKVRYSSSLGSPEGYPAENSIWKDSGYHLYKTTTLPRNQHIISLCPKAIMNVGDTFTIRVAYSGGGYQDFFVSTAYVLTDWSRILTYNGTTIATNEGQHTTAEAVRFSTSTLEVVFSKPLDEDGNPLTGLRYSIIVSSCEADPSGVLPVPAGFQEYRQTDHPTVFTEGTSSWTVALHQLVTFEAGYYYITPVAESADGQRNGEQIWFHKL